MFTDKDLLQLEERGINIEHAKQQLEILKKGISFVDLAKAATVGKGIKKLNINSLSDYVNRYEQSLPALKMIKFVPASGAATRMFKALHEADTLCRQPDFDPKIFQNDAYQMVHECFDRLEDFAFFEDLRKSMKGNGIDMKDAIKHITRSYLIC